MKDKESRDDASIPLLPFDPRLVGPVDLLAAGVGRLRAFCSENSRELVLGVTLILIAQMIIAAQWDVWFLGLPRLPNWMLVGMGAVIFAMPYATLFGVLLAKGLYKPQTVTLSVQDPVNGDQEIEHVSTDLFESLTIKTQNDEIRKREYLETVRINGRRAYEVDSFDRENGVIIASSMAGRTNSDVRADRIAIRNIKTEMEKQVNEAMELKIRARDLVREQAMVVANHVIRTVSGIEIPDGEHLHDRLQESIEDVEPLQDLHTPDHDDDDDGNEQDSDESGGEQGGLAQLDGEDDLIGIFGRAAQGENGGAPADD